VNISFLPEPKLLGAFKRASFIQQQQLESLSEIRTSWGEPPRSRLEKLQGETGRQRGKQHTEENTRSGAGGTEGPEGMWGCSHGAVPPWGACGCAGRREVVRDPGSGERKGLWVFGDQGGVVPAWAGVWGQPGDGKDEDSVTRCPRRCSIPRTARPGAMER